MTDSLLIPVKACYHIMYLHWQFDSVRLYCLLLWDSQSTNELLDLELRMEDPHRAGFNFVGLLGQMTWSPQSPHKAVPLTCAISASVTQSNGSVGITLLVNVLGRPEPWPYLDPRDASTDEEWQQLPASPKGPSKALQESRRRMGHGKPDPGDGEEGRK